MLRRQFVWLLFFITLLSAEPVINIDNDPIKLENFSVGYYVDHTEKLSLEAVEKKQFKKIKNRFSMGTNANVIWIKIKLHNESNQTQELFVHNIYTYLSYDTSFYEVENSKLIGEIKYTLPLNYNTDKMAGAQAVYRLSLRSKQSKTLYMRSHFKAYHEVELGIYDEKNSYRNLVNKFIPSIIMTSILLTLAFYHFILFFFGRRIEYIYYSLYLISASVFISYTYGALSHYFFIYGDLALRLSATTLLPPIFLALFVKTIFATAEKFPLHNRILNSFVVLFFTLWLYSFYRYYQAIELTSLLGIYFFIGMFWVVFSLYRKRVPFSGYFLIAHIFYLLFIAIAILFYNGLLPFNYFTIHSLGTGTLIEALLLGFLVSYRVKLLEEDNQIKDKQILQNSRMAQMGEMISMIAHQWRQPLGAISTVTMGLVIKIQMGAYDLKDEKGIQACQKKVLDSSDKIDKLVEDLSDTIDDFRNFYKPNKDIKVLPVGLPISKALQIIEASLVSDNIKIVQELKSDKSIQMYDSELMQVILSIFQNTQDNFREKDIKDAYIIVLSKDVENGVEIKFIDNGGGIAQNIIEYIFDPYFSTKPEKTGSGLGLSMSKTIIHNHHKGSITATNTEDGVCFAITLKDRIG